jgi:hypothetical protein
MSILAFGIVSFNHLESKNVHNIQKYSCACWYSHLKRSDTESLLAVHSLSVRYKKVKLSVPLQAAKASGG